MKHASICLLAYQRPVFLIKTLESLINTPAGYPYELIVHDDGSDPVVKGILNSYMIQGKISFLIQVGGSNMGIEKAVRRCVAVSSGDYIFKLDTDLTFKPDWLKTAVGALEKPEVGAVGLLDYRNYDPKDVRFHNITPFLGKSGESDSRYWQSDNFVSSAYGFRREVFEKHGSEMRHDGWHLLLYELGYKLAITNPDVVINHGFGIHSIYVNHQTGEAVDMDHPPKLF
jgi:glycosyltransferase involved in cell wall biosynthesis